MNSYVYRTGRLCLHTIHGPRMHEHHEIRANHAVQVFKTIMGTLRPNDLQVSIMAMDDGGRIPLPCDFSMQGEYIGAWYTNGIMNLPYIWDHMQQFQIPVQGGGQGHLQNPPQTDFPQVTARVQAPLQPQNAQMQGQTAHHPIIIPSADEHTPAKEPTPAAPSPCPTPEGQSSLPASPPCHLKERIKHLELQIGLHSNSFAWISCDAKTWLLSLKMANIKSQKEYARMWWPSNEQAETDLLYAAEYFSNFTDAHFERKAVEAKKSGPKAGEEPLDWEKEGKSIETEWKRKRMQKQIQELQHKYACGDGTKKERVAMKEQLKVLNADTSSRKRKAPSAPKKAGKKRKGDKGEKLTVQEVAEAPALLMPKPTLKATPVFTPQPASMDIEVDNEDKDDWADLTEAEKSARQEEILGRMTLTIEEPESSAPQSVSTEAVVGESSGEIQPMAIEDFMALFDKPDYEDEEPEYLAAKSASTEPAVDEDAGKSQLATSEDIMAAFDMEEDDDVSLDEDKIREGPTPQNAASTSTSVDKNEDQYMAEFFRQEDSPDEAESDADDDDPAPVFAPKPVCQRPLRIAEPPSEAEMVKPASEPLAGTSEAVSALPLDLASEISVQPALQETSELGLKLAAQAQELVVEVALALEDDTASLSGDKEDDVDSLFGDDDEPEAQVSSGPEKAEGLTSKPEPDEESDSDSESSDEEEEEEVDPAVLERRAKIAPIDAKIAESKALFEKATNIIWKRRLRATIEQLEKEKLEVEGDEENAAVLSLQAKLLLVDWEVEFLKNEISDPTKAYNKRQISEAIQVAEQERKEAKEQLERILEGEEEAEAADASEESEEE